MPFSTRRKQLAWGPAASLKRSLSNKRWVEDHPTIARHRSSTPRFPWNGQLEEAETMDNADCRTGDAKRTEDWRAYAWRGELQRSERAWREVLDIGRDQRRELTASPWYGRHRRCRETRFRSGIGRRIRSTATP